MLDFETFYLGTAGRLTRFAYGLTGDPAEAQDFTQEAYARAWQRWRKVRAYDNPEAWLRLVVTRLAADRWRWLKVRRHADLSKASSIPPPDEERMTLVAALKQLPLEQRQALALHYLLDRSVADIAAETGTSANTVKSWLSRGRANLATVLIEEAEKANQPQLQGVWDRARQRRKRTATRAIAFLTAATACAATWLFLLPQPIPPAENPVIRFSGEPRIAMTDSDAARSYTTWIGADGTQMVAVIELATRKPVFEPVSLGKFGDTNGFMAASGAILLLTEQGFRDNPLIKDGQDTIIAVDPDTGRVMWTLPYSFNDTDRVLFDDLLVISWREQGRVEGLDLRTGRVRWTRTERVLRGGVLAMGSTGNIAGLRPPLGGLQPADRRVMLHLADGTLATLDVNSGTILTRRPGASGDGSGVINNGYYYFKQGTSIWRMEIGGHREPQMLHTVPDGQDADLIGCGALTCLVVTHRNQDTTIVALDDRMLWQYPVRGPVRWLAATDSGLLVSTLEHGSILLDLHGAAQATYPGYVDWLEPGKIMTTDGNGVFLLNLRTGQRIPITSTPPINYCSWNLRSLTCPTKDGISVWSLSG